MSSLTAARTITCMLMRYIVTAGKVAWFDHPDGNLLTLTKGSVHQRSLTR